MSGFESLWGHYQVVTKQMELNTSRETVFEEFRKLMLPYQGTLVLDDFTVKRLVDVVDEEDDFYWVFDTKKGIQHSSCVGGWCPLKGVLPDHQYRYRVRLWNLNHEVEAV